MGDKSQGARSDATGPMAKKGARRRTYGVLRTTKDRDTADDSHPTE